VLQTPSTCIIPWSTVSRSKQVSHLISPLTLLYSILYIPTITSYPTNLISAPCCNSILIYRVQINNIQIDLLQILLQSQTNMASKCVTKLARSLRPSASPDSPAVRLQVYLVTRLFTASKCISNLAQSRIPSTSQSSPDYGVVKQRRSQCIRRECATKGSSRSWRSTGTGWQDVAGYPAVRNNTNCEDLWTHGKISGSSLPSYHRMPPPMASPCQIEWQWWWETDFLGRMASK